MNSVILGNVGCVSKKLFKSEGKKSFMVLRVVSAEQNDQKTYINVHIYDKLADIVDKYVVPGSKVNIGGRLKDNPRTTKSGDKISELVVVASNVEFLSSPKKKGSTEAPATPAETEKTPETPSVEDEPAAPAAPTVSEPDDGEIPASAFGAEDEDEDLPC